MTGALDPDEFTTLVPTNPEGAVLCRKGISLFVGDEQPAPVNPTAPEFVLMNEQPWGARGNDFKYGFGRGHLRLRPFEPQRRYHKYQQP